MTNLKSLTSCGRLRIHMSKVLYAVPDTIKAAIGQAKYSRWLHAKANAHVRRDRKRYGKESCTVALYKAAIHLAVCEGGERDFYTGEMLNWELVSKWENAASKEGRSKYKRRFALLPTLDRSLNEKGQPKFVICSWRVNDAKSDLTTTEFLALKYRDSQKTGGGGGSRTPVREAL